MFSQNQRQLKATLIMNVLIHDEEGGVQFAASIINSYLSLAIWTEEELTLG